MLGEEFTSPKKLTYHCFREWSEDTGEHYTMTQVEFNEKMLSKFEEGRSKGGASGRDSSSSAARVSSNPAERWKTSRSLGWDQSSRGQKLRRSVHVEYRAQGVTPSPASPTRLRGYDLLTVAQMLAISSTERLDFAASVPWGCSESARRSGCKNSDAAGVRF
jgi:hypothetical protein